MELVELRAVTDRLVGAFERMKDDTRVVADYENHDIETRLYYIDEAREDLKEIVDIYDKLHEQVQAELDEYNQEELEDSSNPVDV